VRPNLHDSAGILNSSQTAMMPRQAAVRRSVLPLYAALAAIFIIAIAYHVRALEQVFPQWFGANFVQWPFLLDTEDRPYFVAQFLYENAYMAGLRDGDTLIAINGSPLTSRSVYPDILSMSHPGDLLKVTYRRNGEGLDRQASIRLLKARNASTVQLPNGSVFDPNFIAVLFYAAMPAFCLALGFWVVSVRLRDVRAWLLLGVMLSVATFFNSVPDLWGPRFRTLGSTYLLLQQGSWFGWLFLLGI
jgi:hypothetical protein